MIVNRLANKTSWPLWGLLLLLGGVSSTSVAEEEQVYMEHERHGALELTLQYSRIQGQEIHEVGNFTLDADNGFGWGASFGYNLNNHLLLGLEFMGANQSYDAVSGGQVVATDLDMDQVSTHFNATWHFQPGQITPFVTLGVGWANVDSNIPRGDAQRDCRWDSWWGYECSTVYPTYTDAKVSANTAVGMRWDFHTQFFARISVGKQWLDINQSDMSSPAIARFEIGFRR